MPTIGILAAAVFAGFALCMALPMLVALIEGNWRALEAMVLVSAAYGFLASVTILALIARRRTLNRAGVFTAAIVIWLSFVAAATPVFILVEGHSVVGALFEASSAVTTMGITLRPLSDISASMAFYRATIAWLGGLLTLMMAVYVLGPYRVGGTPSANLRQVQHARTEEDPRFGETLQEIGLPYLALTMLCALLLGMTGVAADDAVVVAMSMLSTNGFVPDRSSSSVLDNGAAETIMVVFMLVGATSIVWHRLVCSRNFADSREHSEGVLFLAAVAVLIVAAVLASIVAPPSGLSGIQAALNYVFDIVSMVTTTGIAHDTDSGISLPFELVLLIVFIGGCSYSTAGGIKAFRVMAMLKHVGNELERLVYPSAILREDAQYDDQHRMIAKSIWSAFFLAVLTITVGILLFALQGHALPNAIGLGAGAFSQVGGLVDDAVPGLTQGAVSDGTLLTIAGLALVARVEILIVLAAIAGKRW